MTDKTELNHSATQLERDLPEHQLPPELDIAVRQARERQPESDGIIQCIRNAKRLSGTPVRHSHFTLNSARFGRRMAIVGSLAAAAAAVYLIVTWDKRPVGPEPERAPTVALSLPVYSTVTRVSLVEVGYRHIEADLDRADAELAQASEAIALSAVRRDVQQTLEEFYDWSDRGE